MLRMPPTSFSMAWRRRLIGDMRRGVPILRQALRAFEDTPTDPQEHAGSAHPAAEGYAFLAAVHAWDDDAMWAIGDRWARLCREAGALTELPLALNSRGLTLLFAGELDGAASLVAELRVAREATGIGFAPYAEMGLMPLHGNDNDGSALIGATVRDASLRGEGNCVSAAEWGQRRTERRTGPLRAGAGCSQA